MYYNYYKPILGLKNQEFMQSEMKNNQGHQTELVKRALVRYILDSKLQVGDKLPTQTELRRRLAVGNMTIGRAVKALEQDGVLEVRGRTGVFVGSAEADGYIGRHIGIACMRLTDYPFGASLLQCLEIQLHDHACQVMPFLRLHDTLSDRDSLSLFNGLRRNVLQRRVDGLITTVSLDEKAWDLCDAQRVPVCAVGSYNRQRRGVFLDYEYVIGESLRLLAARGFQRPGLVSTGYPVHRKLKEIFGIWNFGGLDMTDYCCLQMTAPLPHEDPGSIGPWLTGVVEKFLHMPPERRPDALLVPDDILAGGIYLELLRQGWATRGSALPELLFMRNKQVPCIPNVPGSFWECDIMAMAQLTVNRLLEYLQGRDPDTAITWYRPGFNAHFTRSRR